MSKPTTSMTFDNFQEFMFNIPIVFSISKTIRQRVMIGKVIMSIQASEYACSNPRETGCREYHSWEIGYPEEVIPELIPYADSDDYTQTVYGYVPTQIILNIIDRLGGISLVPNPTQNEETK